MSRFSSSIWPKIGEYEHAMVDLNTYVKDRMFNYIQAIDTYLAGRLSKIQAVHHPLQWRGHVGGRRDGLSGSHAVVRAGSGVTAAQFAGRNRADRKIVTLDMGGTSTDISLVRTANRSYLAAPRWEISR